MEQEDNGKDSFTSDAGKTLFTSLKWLKIKNLAAKLFYNINFIM